MNNAPNTMTQDNVMVPLARIPMADAMQMRARGTLQSSGIMRPR